MELFPYGPALNSLDAVLPSPSGDVRPPQLSIDTAFVDAEDWNRVSSPLSTTTSSMPTTPSYTGALSPSAHHFGPYTAEACDRPMHTSFNGSEHFPVYSSDYPSNFNDGSVFVNSPSDFCSFEQEKFSTSHTDSLELGTYMASLPHYPL